MKLPSIVSFLLLVALTGFSHAAEHPKKGGEHPKAGGEHPSAKAADAKVLGLAFHADWCPTCKALAPNLSAVKPEFEDKIRFVRLDLTNDETKAEAAKQADELGLTEVYRAHEGKTGFVLLVDGKSHEVLQTVTADMDADAIRGSMNAALSGSAASEHPKAEHPAKKEHPGGKEHPGKTEHPVKKETLSK